MKRSLIALLVGAASQAMAQTPEDSMEHVLVSVPIHKKTSETALPVTVLSGEELRRAVSSSLGETLGDMPGITNSSFGPGVGRPVIRGQAGPRTLNLQNGIASADVSSLSPDHAVGVEPMLADSIEVLRGPSTLLYGGGAIGGVVNTVDNRIPRAAIEGIQGAVEYRYDDASEMDTFVGKLEGGTGNFAFHLSGSTRDFDDLDIPDEAIDVAALEEQEELLGGHDEEEHGEEEIENSDGFIANTDGDADVYTIGASYQLGERGFFGLAYNSFETNYGIPPGAHEHEEGEDGEEGEEEEEEIIRIDLEQKRYDANLHLHDLVPGWIDVARGFLTYTDYEHVELEGAEVGTQFERDTWEGRLELVREGDNHSVLGVQWLDDEFEAEGEEAYIPKTDSTEYGVFFLQDFHLDEWQFEVGVRGDWVERDPTAPGTDSEDFTSLSLSGAVIKELSTDWTASLALSSSERAPATEELFSNAGNDPGDLVTHAATGIIEVGDSDLDQETSLNADLMFTWQNERSLAQVTFFYNTFEDYIFLSNTGEDLDETAIFAYEQDDADFYGVELETRFHLVDLYGGGLGLGVFGDMVSGEFDDAGDVPRLPPMRVGAELFWGNDNFNAFVKVLNADDQDDPGDFETETDGYTRWDIGMDYRFELMENTEMLAFVKWKNIGDEEIRLSTSFLRNFAPQAGESIEAGLRMSF